jgi:hypothetical protein
MYVSVTGLKPKGFIGWVRFWIFTTSVSLSAQKADGILLCEFNSRNGYQHTLTVWETKEHMMAFRASPAHVRAMKRISQIGIGKVFGYEADFSPSWEDALSELDRNGSEF